LRDHSHQAADDSEFCSHCGQPMPGTREPSYGERKANRTGLIATVLLHLLVVAIYFLQPNPERHAKPPERAAMVWVAPLPAGKPKPTPQAQAPRPTVKPVKPVKTVKPTRPQRVEIKRLPNPITTPQETPVEVAEKEEPKKVEKPAPPEMDMAAAIAARRAQRGTPAPSDTPAAESDDARANRIAKANIASANGKSRGDDNNDSGGVFSLSNRTFHSADLKFRGWNPNFKRRWLTSVTVEQGSNPDLETAIVAKMIELIRKEKTGDFEWDSHRLQRVVTLSARPADTAALQAFLLKEMFPEYKSPRG
jgi:type IV secretory pathway VirB10-like protein